MDANHIPPLLSADEFKELLRTGKTKKYASSNNTDYDIVLSNIEITESVVIEESFSYADILLKEGVVFNEDVVFRRGFFAKITFSGVTFKKDLLIKGGEYNDFSVVGGSYMFTHINGGKFNTLWLEAGTFKWFTVEKVNINHLSINGRIQFGHFWVNDGCIINEFNIQGGEFKTFACVTLCRIHKLKFGLRVFGNISVADVKVSELHFQGFFGEFKIDLMYIQGASPKSSPHIYIQRSVLDSINFLGCGWSNGTLIMDDSKIINCDYANTQFPKRVTTQHAERLNEKVTDGNERQTLEKAHLLQLRDTYSQLKTMADRQNDRRSSLYYQAKSNKTISMILTLQLSQNRKWLDIRSDDWWEWLQFRLNTLTNNLGMSYVRPALLLLLTGLVLFCAYVPAASDQLMTTWKERSLWTTALLLTPSMILGKRWWIGAFLFFMLHFGIIFLFVAPSWPEELWNGLTYASQNYADDYWRFLNPLRKTNVCLDMPHSCGNWLASCIDWFSRIWFSYLIYQFIQAFRKYGKP